MRALERAGAESLPQAEDQTLADAVWDAKIPDEYYGQPFHSDHLGSPFDTRLEDPLNILRYVTVSSYSRHVTRWEKVFPELRSPRGV